jgi:hypothetical protein
MDDIPVAVDASTMTSIVRWGGMPVAWADKIDLNAAL